MTSTMLLICFIVVLACTTHGNPQGGSFRRDLRGRLNGNRGGAAGRFYLKGMNKRDPVLFNPMPLPKPLSGHAVVVDQRQVYISGGCDSPLGHQINQNTSRYICSHTTDSFYKFDPSVDNGRGIYTTLANLPRPRYRHTSAVVDGKIWLVGGRDVDDKLIDTIDVYDIVANEWSTTVLPQIFTTSDHATFSNKKFVYIAGGFDQGYNETNVVYRIDTETYTIETVSSLPSARGGGTFTQTSQYAYVAGGSRNCQLSRLVERFDFASGTWTRLPRLKDSWDNVQIVALNSLVVLLPGEKDIKNICPTTSADMEWSASVQVLDSNSWQTVNTNIMVPRSQSASIAIETTHYTFGGSLQYDSTCQCYPSTDEVVVNWQLYDQAVGITPTSTSVPLPVPPPQQQNTTIVNDQCESAVELEVVPEGMDRIAPAFGTTVGATIDLDAPICDGIAVKHPGVWFQVVSPTRGSLTAQTCGSYSKLDTQLSVYQGSCRQLECVTADDDSCSGNQARVGWEAERGQVYYLLLHGWAGVGNYQVSVQVKEPPNDTCNHAQGTLIPGSSVEGNTAFASQGLQDGTCGEISYGAVEGVWYSVIGTGSVLVVDTCDDATDYDTKLHVFAGSCSRLECVGGNDNSAECGSITSRRSLVRWQTKVNELYWIYVHGFEGFSPRGYFVLSLSEE